MAAVTVLSTCGAASFSASAADARHGYPELSEVISKLDEDEIVNRKMEQNERKYPVEKAKGSAVKYDQL